MHQTFRNHFLLCKRLQWKGSILFRERRYTAESISYVLFFVRKNKIARLSDSLQIFRRALLWSHLFPTVRMRSLATTSIKWAYKRVFALSLQIRTRLNETQKTEMFCVSFYGFPCTYLRRKGENLFYTFTYYWSLLCLFKLSVRGCFFFWHISILVSTSMLFEILSAKIMGFLSIRFSLPRFFGQFEWKIEKRKYT